MALPTRGPRRAQSSYAERGGAVAVLLEQPERTDHLTVLLHSRDRALADAQDVLNGRRR